MEKLDCMIVHGAMLSDPKICAILLRSVMLRFLKTEMHYLQTFNIEM